ncbi:lipid-A-disaccharide synthase [Devosia sp. SL43]|uniref:lipid-A-disaccharide synthase n=1 Tax=Devosia sp. SL43 TaxID=2806348 RepID=UPI001F17A1B5|nr:lipid-A-disaccharide synthase [Devosia sp. SL43]UJW86298.1 lipid-A-disaccharide synthase [Devosia sp. SL43]
MADPLKLFILAGEASGDRIGADLLARLRSRVPLDVHGVGGDELTADGLKSLYPMSDLAVMGISDVLRRLPLLLWRIEQTARAICKLRPDIVVLIDAQDFSKLLAQRMRSLGYAGRRILYVSPSVWARHPERAAKLKPLFDEVLAVLPFEPAAMQRLGGPPTSYVGHPALAEALQGRAARDHGPLILLPGSREGELRRHLPAFREVVESLAGHPAVEEIVIPTLPSLLTRIRAEVGNWAVPVTVIADRGQRADLYSRAVAALAVSGTATLELALAQLPMVVSYVMDNHQASAYQRYGRPAVSLPNIILGRPVVPELVQAPADPVALSDTLRALLDDKKARQNQIEAFGELAHLMETGEPEFPRRDPADRVLSHWQGYQRLVSPT